MAKKVHSSHEENEVAEEQPVSFEGDLALGDESFRNVAVSLADGHALVKRVSLGKAQTEYNDKDWWTSAEPEKGTPSVAGGVDEAAGKGRCEEVAEGVTLLQHTGDETSGSFRAIFECSGGGVSIEASHGNSEEGAAGEELFVGLTETGTEFENDEEKVIDDKGPFAAVSVCGNTEDDTSD